MVNLAINATICQNLTHYENYTNQVQEEVSRLKIVGNYFDNLPTIIMSILLGKVTGSTFGPLHYILSLLGPLSDQGRKLLMYIPFIGHIVSGGYLLVFLYFETLPAQYLWFQYIYTLCGGYTVLQIAMYGYIGDVTTNS